MAVPDASDHQNFDLAFGDAPGSLAANIYARFRLTTDTLTLDTASANGPASDGEVEDYLVGEEPVDEYDFGDAPDPTYPILLASNGARHIINGPRLGASVDVEADGQPSATATGDDVGGTDDEDGVTFSTSLVPGNDATVQVLGTNVASRATTRHSSDIQMGNNHLFAACGWFGGLVCQEEKNHNLEHAPKPYILLT